MSETPEEVMEQEVAASTEESSAVAPPPKQEPEPKQNLDDDPLDELFLGHGEDISDEAFAEAMGAQVVGRSKEAEAEEDDPEIDEAQLEALLDKLEGKAQEEEEEEPEEAEAEDKAEEPDPADQPAPSIEFPDLTLDEDTHYEVMANHESFNMYIKEVQARTAEAVMQQMGPAMLNAAIQVQGALKFEQDIFEQFPSLRGRPNIVNKALITAQKKAPGAGYQKWFEMTVKELEPVAAVQRSLQKNGKVRDFRRGDRGRFAPKAERRASRTYEEAPPADGTTTALNEIASLGSRSGAALIHELGLD